MFDAEVAARFRARRPGGEITLTRRYRQSPDKVFAAVSIPERIADWMGVEWLGDPAPLKVGSSFSYRFKNSDMETQGRVTRLETGRVIEHTWFENLAPPAVIRWAVEPDGDGSLLTLTHSYPAPDDATRNGAGWTMILHQLDAWLSGDAFRPPESWAAVRDRYAQSFGPEAVLDGRKLSIGGRPAVAFKRVVDRPVAEVWAYLTEKERLARWLGDVDVELRPGGDFRIRFVMAPVVMEGTITEIEPPSHLALIWREPWFKTDEVILSFDLEPYGEGTLLTLTHSFPAGYDPSEYLAGWHEFLDALQSAMDGQPFDFNAPERKRRYEVLGKIYKAVEGAEKGAA